MFPWRKTKKEPAGQPYLVLYDAQMTPLHDGPLNLFSFPEQVILAGSEEFFNDPTPCEIHRRAVQLRFYGEIMQFLPRGQVLAMKDVPENIQGYLIQHAPAFVMLEDR